MIALWLRGLLLRLPGRLFGAIIGVALTVALIAALGTFLIASSTSMTRRASDAVPVDWQVELMPGTDSEVIEAAIGQATAISRLQLAGYADVEGLEASIGGTVQTTGAGKVVGLDSAYLAAFPGQFRLLLGTLGGVMLAQQAAANLHVTVGDTFTIGRVGLPAAELRVAGIIDLPNADSMFQAVGIPPGAAPQAPPDNVALIPLDQWHGLFDQQAVARPDTVRLQLHANLVHDGLPGTPNNAYAAVLRAGRNLEARIAGSGILANNLAARLDAVRGDSLYARVLFLFLGAPGAVIATLLTVAVAASGGARRRHDQALLRVRGASTARLLALVAAEGIVIGVAGAAIGLLLAAAVSRFLLGIATVDIASAIWFAIAAVIGLQLALAALLLPAWSAARQSTVSAQRQAIGPERVPLWRRGYLDLILLLLAGIIFWQAASTGYQIVLAPEGVPAASVEYHAFLAPLLLWLGLGLLTLRLGALCLGAGRPALRVVLSPLAGRLAGVVAASLSRQKRRIMGGIALTALAFAFATSTAVFNTTYNAQALVDAELTNGADVTVSGPPFVAASARLAELRSLPGVIAAEPMQHRLAYVGNDLQDLYGIDPTRIGTATHISNAYFQDGDAAATMALLGRTPDGVLVSEETVTDFQLQQGDQLNLRLQSAVDHQYHVVPFKFIGVVREFPTAPRDSFLVANASYVAEQTGSNAAEIVLIRAAASPDKVAAAIRTFTASTPGLKVSDLGATQKIIGSSLTAVDLSGLTRLELGFALFTIAGATGLVLALGLADRRRTYAILSLLGAKPHQLGSFLWSEALLMFVAGTVIGALAGFGIAWMLVKLLTGVFDPAPEGLQVPWIYLVAMTAAAFLSVVAAVMGALRETQTSPIHRLRDI